MGLGIGVDLIFLRESPLGARLCRRTVRTRFRELLMRRWILFAVGILLAAIGVVWVLQGIGVITGSFMTGQKLWFLIGLVALLVGVVLAAAMARKPGGRKVG